MTGDKTYLFEFIYGKRTDELDFISDLLQSFDNNSLTGITLLANNNVYNLEFLLLLVFEKDSQKFDNWLVTNYPKKKNNFKFNYFTKEIIDNQIKGKRYNAYSFSTVEQLKFILTDDANKIFLYPTIKKMNSLWDKPISHKVSTIFLSHSSSDKPLVEQIFLELQKEELNVWFDKYEIDFGDSITEKINQGLSKSELGIICLSKSFLSSSWAKSEMNFFIQKRINNNQKNFICLILDLEHSEIPPLLQDYRYITTKDNNWEQQLIDSIKKSCT